MADLRGAVEPQNAATALAHQIAEINLSRGKPAGRDFAAGGPRVRSASFGPALPLPAEEKRRLDRLAVAAGAMPPDVLDELDEVTPPSVPSLGTHVPQEIVAPEGSLARMPDFTRIEAIDLVRNELIIDGLRLAVPEVEVRALKQWAVELAMDALTRRVAEAMVALGLYKAEEPPTGTAADVQVPDMPEGVTGD